MNVSFYKKRTCFSRVTIHSHQKSPSSPPLPLCSAAVPTWFWDTQWSGSTPSRFSFLCPNHWALKSTIHFKLIFVVDLHFSLRFVIYLTCPCQVTLLSPVEKGTPTPITPPSSRIWRFIDVDELLSAPSHWLYCFPVDASLANWKTVALCSIILPWDCFNYSNVCQMGLSILYIVRILSSQVPSLYPPLTSWENLSWLFCWKNFPHLPVSHQGLFSSKYLLFPHSFWFPCFYYFYYID